MSLKSQDVLVLLKLVARGKAPWTYNGLAVELDLSPSQVHAAVQRAVKSGLAYEADDQIYVHTRNLEEFLVHGIRYLFVPERGAKTRGMATLTSAPPLAALFVNGEEPIVWPDSSGELRGESLAPIYKTAPRAARSDPGLYELLVIADALRAGRTRERQAAAKELKKKLQKYG
ncbi:MAG: hypothetical protein GWP64_07245 [Gammaproteobacteria bacterium]|jgi:hypothetical protein|nr:hypothetical protein [Gammaproteobacteria bacterium]